MGDSLLTLTTAPSELPFFDELDISETGIVNARNPKSFDVAQANWFGEEQAQRRARRRSFGISIDHADENVVEQVESWFFNRRLLRLLGNYNASTEFYQFFSRRDAANGIGSQIGTAPAYLRSDGSNVDSTEVDEDSGKLVRIVDDDIPRYGPCCWGKRGLFVEAEKQNSITESHSTSIFDGWASDAGAPTIGFDIDRREHMVDEGGALRVLMVAADSVYRVYATSAYTKGSLSVYLSGHGFNVNVIAYDDTGAATLRTVSATLTNEWTRIDLYDLDLTGVNTLRIRITAVGASVVHIGNVQFEEQTYPTSHCHSTLVGQFSGYDQINLADLKSLTNEGAIHVCIPFPNALSKDTHWICSSASGTEFYIDKNAGLVYFQKKTGSYVVSYVPTIFTDVPTILSVTWGSANLKLYENGVLKDTTSLAGVGHTLGDELSIGNHTLTDESFGGTIQWFRVDSSETSADEVAEIASRYLDDNRRMWALRAEGRDFAIRSLPIKILVGPNQYRIKMVIDEVRSYDTATVEER